jgi:signal transduction histidine kinase
MDENGKMLYSTGGTAHPDGTVFKTDGSANYDYICLIGEPQKNEDLDHFEDYPLAHVKAPADTVTLYIQPNALLNGVVFDLLILVWNLRYDLFWILAVSLLLFAVGAVYLCCAAGKMPGREELKPGGFNCLPLDLYALMLATGVGFSILFLEEGTRLDNNIPLLAMYVGSIIFADCLLLVAFCFACAAQFKLPKLYWLRHTLCGIGVISSWKILKWMLSVLRKMWNWILANVPPAVKKMGNSLLLGTKKCWNWIVQWGGNGLQLMKRLLVAVGVGIAALFKWVGRTLHRFLCLMPLTWQWLLTGFVMTMVLYICLRSYKTGWILIGFGVFFGIILYGAHAFGILMENARNMGKGDLETKISDRFLVGAFRDFAGDLNVLADVAKVAAQEQMKSERMKTELITNVSHDIKTPLTSIINYVDLLEKPHTIEEERQYLEVLGRKSQQLKKLIGDLTEMSKASSGSIAVNVEWVDATEAINQALGEFSDKLELCRLTPVFNRPEEPVYIRADGRLTWRVLSNLLSNAVKYAMPGTRLYIDLSATENRATISLKNISKEPLNVDAQELMERFVRGDASRNTEGSGLGLNIAKSLMEVQNGQLTLTVDGDLFKATLQFPVTKQ